MREHASFLCSSRTRSGSFATRAAHNTNRRDDAMTPFLILNRGCVVVLLISASFAGQTAQQTAWSLLRTGTASKSTQDRSGAVRVLGLIARNRQAKAMAIEALKDPKPEVRAAAAIA